MGKRKIAIEEIKDDRQRRSVTFTKRRDGLFKKAETACQKFGGLQIGIVVFSPAGKPFTFTNSSSSLSLDQIIDTYIMTSSSSSTTSTSSSSSTTSTSSSSSTTSTSSSAVAMGKKRNRSDEDDDDVQVIETEEKKRKTMNAVVTPPPPPLVITVEADEKLDQGFHWDHYQNLDSDQTPHDHDQDELRNEAGIIATEEVINMESSSQILIEGESSHNWTPDVQEIINIEDDDDFEYDNGIVTEEEEMTMESSQFLVPPPATTTPTSTSTTSTMGFRDLLLSASSDMNSAEEDYGYTLEEWDQILSTSPTTVVVHTSSCMNQEEVEVEADNWPTQEFVQLLCS